MNRKLLLTFLIIFLCGIQGTDSHSAKTILVVAETRGQDIDNPISLQATKKAITAASSHFADVGFRVLNNEVRNTLSMELENFGEVDIDDDNGAKIETLLRKNHVDVYVQMVLSYYKTQTKMTMSADAVMYNLTTSRIIASVRPAVEAYISGDNIAGALHDASRKVGYRTAKLLVNKLRKNPDLLKQLQSFEYMLTFNGFSVDENDQIVDEVESIVSENNILPPRNTSGFLELTITSDKNLRKLAREIKTRIAEKGLNLVKTMGDGSKVVFKKEGSGFGIGEIEIN